MIRVLRGQGFSCAEIVRQVGRCRFVVKRELDRNGVVGGCQAVVADAAAVGRCVRWKSFVVDVDEVLRQRVWAVLRVGGSPGEYCGTVES